MNFRLKAFGLHFLVSACVLTLVLGGLYLGWYRWPGWYLTNALTVAPILAAADVSLGPLLTLLIANPRKPRREVARDIAIIAVVQLAALVYGSATLWNGRPLYYAFSEDRLQLVQASDLDPSEIALAKQQNPRFAPYWYRLPRWVWAPLPGQAAERDAIVQSAIGGGNDVIQMPRYFKPWSEGLPKLREQLLTVEQQRDIRFFKKKPKIKALMTRLGFVPVAPVTLLMTGQSAAPLLAVFDRSSLKIETLLRTDFERPPAAKPVPRAKVQ